MPSRYCMCCDATFPPDEGYYGDICTRCGWECDDLEPQDVLTVYDDGQWTLSIKGYSSANKLTLSQAQLFYTFEFLSS